MNEKKLRPWIYVFVTLMHFILILFIVFETDIKIIPAIENTRIIRLINLEEISPQLQTLSQPPRPQIQTQSEPPQPQVQRQAEPQLEPVEPHPPSTLPVILSPLHEDDDIPEVESIAEVMIETDIPPVQTVVAPGTHMVPAIDSASDAAGGPYQSEDEYLPVHLVSSPVQFDVNEIIAALVYPPIALRSGIEGRVILELFIDRTGAVQRITVLREEPEGRGFGEAAVRAFTGRTGSPAMDSNGRPVSMRLRYPLTFRPVRN
ncbi:MAG: TonB family protein [Treponema sp.]|nr:TonB family protein [Treponema sp.]